MKKKIIWGVIVVVVGGLWLYQAFSTGTTPTMKKNYGDSVVQKQLLMEDWKTYTSNMGKFTFKYPANWLMYEGEGINGRMSVRVWNLVSGLEIYELSVVKIENSGKLTAEEFAHDQAKIGLNISAYSVNNNPNVTGMVFDKEYEVQVGNVKGYELYGVLNNKDQKSEYIYLAYGDSMYIISFQTGEENENLSNPVENNATAHQILSTFKFTN